MNKKMKKNNTAIINIFISMICTTCIVLLVYSITNQNIVYKKSINWVKVEIISEDIQKEDYYTPSKNKGYHKQTRYLNTIKYKLNSMTEELFFYSYNEKFDPIDIRINPKTQNIYIRRKVGLWGYFIRLSGVFIFLLVLIVYVQEIKKKSN